jgi:hypothetical protein
MSVSSAAARHGTPRPDRRMVRFTRLRIFLHSLSPACREGFGRTLSVIRGLPEAEVSGSELATTRQQDNRLNPRRTQRESG